MSVLRAKGRGFTFIEILIVIAVLLIIAVFSVATFRSVYRNAGKQIATQEISDALRDARASSLAAQNDRVYGVFVSTTSVTRFIGDTYSASNASNTVYVFEAGATATGTLVTFGTPVVFARLTGLPTATGTIYIRDADTANTTTITILGTGLIQ